MSRLGWLPLTLQKKNPPPEKKSSGDGNNEGELGRAPDTSPAAIRAPNVRAHVGTNLLRGNPGKGDIEGEKGVLILYFQDSDVVACSVVQDWVKQLLLEGKRVLERKSGESHEEVGDATDPEETKYRRYEEKVPSSEKKVWLRERGGQDRGGQRGSEVQSCGEK